MTPSKIHMNDRDEEIISLAEPKYLFLQSDVKIICDLT